LQTFKTDLFYKHDEIHSLKHKKPFPSSPSRHAHLKLPAVLLQEAFLWHG